MTIIDPIYAEWAVVDRLRAMLKEPPHDQYNVTQAYGLCVPILAWVMQRIRKHDMKPNLPEDKAAITVREKLKSVRVESQPWLLRPKGFTECYAFDFLKWLRDACCHGDARTVFPENKRGELVGFTFRMKAHDGIERSILLRESDLRRIGSSLALLYCNALKEASGCHNSFLEEAQALHEKRNIRNVFPHKRHCQRGGTLPDESAVSMAEIAQGSLWHTK